MMLTPAAIIRSKLSLQLFDSESYTLEQRPFLGTSYKYRFLGTEYLWQSRQDSVQRYYRFYGMGNCLGRWLSDDIENPSSQATGDEAPTSYYAFTLGGGSSSSRHYLFGIREGKPASELGLWVDICSFLNVCNIYFVLFFFVFPFFRDRLHDRFMLYHELRRRQGIYCEAYERERDAFLNGAFRWLEGYCFGLQFLLYLIL